MNRPIFSHSRTNEIWLLLLEKAYAKMYGGYLNIEGGNPSHALKDITGAPYENIEEGEEDEIWSQLIMNIQRGFMLTCYSKSVEG